MEENKNHFEILDLIRGLAAFLVFISHLRALFFLPYNEIINPDLSTRIFYFITGFGHQSVIIFFVLSGYFIIQSIQNNIDRNPIFNWKSYLFDRLSRLWIVLIPSLFITLILDSIGLGVNGNSFVYATQIKEMPEILLNSRNTAADFLGNIFFTQTLYCHTFGTNAALWSLTNEFWYYIYYPILAVSFLLFRKSKSKSVTIYITICIVLLFAIGYFFIQYLFIGFITWILGGLVYYISKKYTYKSNILLIISCIQFLIISFSIRNGWTIKHISDDLILGFSFSFLLINLVNSKIQLKGFLKSVSKFGNMSYTLYLFHLSVSIFIVSFLIDNRFNSVTLNSYLYYSIAGIVVMIYSFLMYKLFEYNTKQIKNWIKATFQF